MTPIWSGKGWERGIRYAPAMRVEPCPLVVTSGLVGRGEDGRIVAGGMAAQARQTFANLRDVLAAAGAAMGDIVKLNYYVTDMTQWEDVAAARAEALSGLLPASATVEVSRLYDPECLIEIEAVAAIRSAP
ncbi:MAG TPA: RidA family protein [Lichenihabitans sp.]|jgi:enamine deaminase RidA (YjgF/YER057c/UK114 family)|nr:RidA family protein [Lichenihabitans sp.]